MVEVIKILMELVNNIHDFLQVLTKGVGWGFNDKQLHFIIIGIIGIVIFGITQALFKWIAKYSITAISFIYTFTILLVIVFAIEIGQKITKRGNMEFADIVAGVLGFIYLFIIYVIIRLIIYISKQIINSKHKIKK